MFILSVVTFVWTLSVFGGVVASYVGGWWRRNDILLRSAHLVVLRGSGEPAGVRKVDVTREMRMLHEEGLCTHKMSLLPRLLKVATSRDIQDTLASYSPPAAALRPLKKTPMCFLDVKYSRNSQAWRRLRTQRVPTVYRCLYPIYGKSDRIVYPPRWTVASNPLPSAADKAAGTMASATLTLRHDGASVRQWSCNVTDQVNGLEGPDGDFHRHASSGYQLRKHILKAVLMPDILALMDSLTHDDEEMATTTFSSSSSSNSSSDSLKSLPYHAATPLSIRVQFQKRNHRVEVLNLDPTRMPLSA